MTTSMPSVSARNHFLDALRGIAALLVLLTHLQSSLVVFYPGGWLAAHPVAISVLDTGRLVWMWSFISLASLFFLPPAV